MAGETKACPFCGEQILAVAIKCKHCGSMLAEHSMPEAAVQAAEVAPVPEGPKAPSVAGVWRMLLGALLILIVAPFPASRVPPDERGANYWYALGAKMSEQDFVLITSEGERFIGAADAKRLRKRIQERQSASLSDILMLGSSYYRELGDLSRVRPSVESRDDVMQAFRSSAENEQARDIGSGIALALCVAAGALSLLTLRKRPWLQGDVSEARQGRAAGAFRMALIAVAMCGAGVAWSAFMLFRNKVMLQPLALVMAVAALPLGWVAIKFFQDAKVLRSPSPGSAE